MNERACVCVWECLCGRRCVLLSNCRSGSVSGISVTRMFVLTSICDFILFFFSIISFRSLRFTFRYTHKRTSFVWFHSWFLVSSSSSLSSTLPCIETHDCRYAQKIRLTNCARVKFHTIAIECDWKSAFESNSNPNECISDVSIRSVKGERESERKNGTEECQQQ